MITLEVNGRSIQAEKDEMLLTALRRAGIRVPTLCHLDGLPASGACRMCVVEVRRPARLGSQLCVSGRRRHEGANPFAPRDPGAEDDRRTALGQSSRRLPLLRAERHLPTSATGRGLGRAAAALRRREEPPLPRHFQPLDSPRSGQVHPLRQVRPRLRRSARRGGDRLHRPRLAGESRHGVRRRA